MRKKMKTSIIVVIVICSLIAVGGTVIGVYFGIKPKGRSKVTCGDGTKLSEDNKCIPSNVARGDGTKTSTDNKRVPSNVVTCGDGTKLSANKCVPSNVVTCGDGTKLDANKCLPSNVVTCGDGTKLDANKCLPSNVVTCGDGTKLTDNKCLPSNVVTCGDGTELNSQNSTCIPFTDSSCDPREKVDSCVTKNIKVNGAPTKCVQWVSPSGATPPWKGFCAPAWNTNQVWCQTDDDCFTESSQPCGEMGSISCTNYNKPSGKDTGNLGTCGCTF